MLKNVKGACDSGEEFRRATASTSSNKSKNKKISQFFDCNMLHDPSPAAWGYIANVCGVKEILKESLSRLIWATHNSERARHGTGFRGGVLDGSGLNRFDYDTAIAYHTHFEKFPVVDGTYVKATVLLLFKYRKQLRWMGIDYPMCLFRPEGEIKL